MASQEELTSALAESLEQRGLLQGMRSQLYGEVLATLHGAEAPVPAARPPPEALLINDLVREYLAYTGFVHTLSVFDMESGGSVSAPDSRERPDGPLLPTQILAAELGISRSGGAPAAEVPLLYHLVAAARTARQTRSQLEEGGVSLTSGIARPSVAPLAGSRVPFDSRLTRPGQLDAGFDLLDGRSVTGAQTRPLAASDTLTVAVPLGLARPVQGTDSSGNGSHRAGHAAGREPMPLSSATGGGGRSRSISETTGSGSDSGFPGAGPHVAVGLSASVSAAGLRPSGLFSAAAPSAGSLLMYAGQ